MSDIFVDIERIVLSDLALPPERAERLRGLVGQKLQHLLEQEGLADGLVNREVSDLSVPMIHPAEMQSDNRLASSVAQRIAQVLKSVG
ncbi:MAG: hypothetical protein ACYSTT_08340 [Planctomycetota bacterium]|jgi:hypothetical protein